MLPELRAHAEAVGCCERTVGRCLQALEAVQLVTWVNRIARVRERVAGLPGGWAATWRVLRTSNSYGFPAIAKATRPTIRTDGQNALGTQFQEIILLEPGFSASLERLRAGVFGSKARAATA